MLHCSGFVFLHGYVNGFQLFHGERLEKLIFFNPLLNAIMSFCDKRCHIVFLVLLGFFLKF